MAHTLTVLTLWFAQAIGLYLIASGVLLLTRPERLAALIGEIEASPLLAVLSGFAAFVVGVAILVPHHLTCDGLALVVTLIAVLACIEGLVLIAASGLILRVARTSVAAPACAAPSRSPWGSSCSWPASPAAPTRSPERTGHDWRAGRRHRDARRSSVRSRIGLEAGRYPPTLRQTPGDPAYRVERRHPAATRRT